MGWGALAEPGTEFGPCAEPCEHIDCAWTRRMRDSLCVACREPIESRPFYTTDVADVFVHAACADG